MTKRAYGIGVPEEEQANATTASTPVTRPWHTHANAGTYEGCPGCEIEQVERQAAIPEQEQ